MTEAKARSADLRLGWKYTMKITSTALRAKRSCASGYRWFTRHFKTPAEYQRVLDALVDDGRVNDACWLLDHFGPVDTERVVDSISADALVFAGSLEVRCDAEVGSVMRVGGSIRAGGSIRTGSLIAGGDLHAAAGVRAFGSLRTGGSIVSAWTMEADLSLIHI